jgi:heme exporter protein D
MTDYLAMGGYAAYVWPAYGITVVGLAAMMIASLRSLARRKALLAALDAARPRRPGRAEPAAAPGPES